MFAYLAETLVFVDLGLSIFTFDHDFSLSITVWGFVSMPLLRCLSWTSHTDFVVFVA